MFDADLRRPGWRVAPYYFARVRLGRPGFAECFYDEEDRLVDRHHRYLHCSGTPDQYPADDSRHITVDKGGIKEEGWDSFWDSRQHDLNRLFGLGL